MNENNREIDQRFKLEGVAENIETVFKAQAPFTETKEAYFGFMGVLLRNKETDKVQCHLCGGWYDFLDSHIRQTHKIKAIKYRKQFGLPLHFPLCANSFSEKSRAGLLKMIEIHKKPDAANLSANGKKSVAHLNTLSAKLNHAYAYKSDAYINRYAACFEQLRSRFLTVSDIVGREPSKKDIEAHDKSLYSQIRRKHGSLNKFRKKVGATPVGKHEHLDDWKIFAALRKWAETWKKNPGSYDFAKGSPNRVTILRRFGSWSRALQSAGLEGA